ncbi:SDR family NAD(P)-dependent oxidoreductase [Hoeflea poritis]|uniref:SDR family NAD(P)-dependent oxidoreductase n=1 Tax=Hoeflea poritis TaxID=2993659 RepID=A0ABT4VS32_9HYPH|nr:SDR family NAD(P)-dependent oxidoreductase [Hoeflea poritis]MDA4847404.1 SDR family NAD(P)-dependent oxidoreductase [Hoeflea poritis]
MAGLFDGATVLITGASGGFGSAAARRYAAEGARLVLSDYDEKALDAIAGAISNDHGCDIASLAGDIADESLSERLAALAVDRFGRLDVALNNAGIAQDAFAKLPKTDSAEARRIFDIDLVGMFYALKHQLPIMERQFRSSGMGGAIVNVASVAGVTGASGLAVYAAAKHGVVGLTRSVAQEYARLGVRINAVCPSFARTPMATEMLGVEVRGRMVTEEQLVRGIPMGRLAEVEEVVEAFIFASSPKNSFMTGQTIHVDGGLTGY